MFVSIPTRTRTTLRWATPMLVALLWLAWLWAATRPDDSQAALLLEWGALAGNPGIAGLQGWTDPGHWLRLFSALFLHADWAHLLGNLVFLLGGAFANLFAVFAIGAPDRLVIGASGAVSALIGAYLALFPQAKLGVVVPLGLFLEFVRAPASLLIGVWALLQVVFAYIGPAFGAVAWAAHVAGFVFGVLFAILSRQGIARRLRKLKGY